MQLVYNTALMARSSSDVLLFKIEVDEDTEERLTVLTEVEGSVTDVSVSV